MLELRPYDAASHRDAVTRFFATRTKTSVRRRCGRPSPRANRPAHPAAARASHAKIVSECQRHIDQSSFNGARFGRASLPPNSRPGRNFAGFFAPPPPRVASDRAAEARRRSRRARACMRERRAVEREGARGRDAAGDLEVQQARVPASPSPYRVRPWKPATRRRNVPCSSVTALLRRLVTVSYTFAKGSRPLFRRPFPSPFYRPFRNRRPTGDYRGEASPLAVMILPIPFSTASTCLFTSAALAVALVARSAAVASAAGVLLVPR